jgi:hypothetical protein
LSVILRLRRRHDLDLAGGRSVWNRGADLGCGNHGERGGGAVKCEAGCAGQICAENFDGRSDIAGSGQGFDERAKANRNAKNSAIVISPAKTGCCRIAPAEDPLAADGDCLSAWPHRKTDRRKTLEVVSANQWNRWLLLHSETLHHRRRGSICAIACLGRFDAAMPGRNQCHRIAGNRADAGGRGREAHRQT